MSKTKYGLDRDDKRLAAIKIGKWYVLPMVVETFEGLCKMKGMFKCFFINEHGVFWFKNNAGVKKSFTWKELIIMMNTGEFYAAKREVA